MIPLSILLLAGYILVFNGLLFKLGLEDKKYLGIKESRAIYFGIFLLAYGLPLLFFFPIGIIYAIVAIGIPLVIISYLPIQEIDKKIMIYSGICLFPIFSLALALFSINIILNFRGKKFPVIYNYSIFFIVSTIIWSIVYWFYFM